MVRLHTNYSKKFGSSDTNQFVLLSPDNVRRITFRELEEVEKLISEQTEEYFGYTSARAHTYDRFLTLALYDEESMIASVSFDDHPNVPALPPWEWYHWLHKLYRIDHLNTSNTLFIHYAVWDNNYTMFFLKPILQHIFEMYEALETIVWVCPPGFVKVDFIDHLTKRHLPYGFVNPKKVVTLFLLKRKDFSCKYTIRRAVEEDNDDLLAIIPKLLEHTYGPYYISEIIRFPNESERQVIVAEHNGCAVGMLCLNNEVNYNLLNENFELVPFNGFKKPSGADEIRMSMSMTGLIPGQEQDQETEPLLFDGSAPSEDKPLPDGEDIQDGGSEDEFSLVNISSSLFFNFLYDEDEEIELSDYSGSDASIESQFSAVILNEEYQDHLYNADRQDSAIFIEPVLQTERRQTRQVKTNQEDVEIPTFHGAPNAFCMEICAAIPEHSACLYLLFQAAFNCFPYKDYCIVSFPTNACFCNTKKHFARVARRNCSLFPHELYVLHRNAILGNVWVRVAHSSDKRYVNHLIVSITKPWVVEEQFREAVDSDENPHKAYVFLCEQQIIGFAIVAEEPEQEYLHFHYALDMWVSFDGNKFGLYGSMELFFVSPVFQRLEPFLLRELHRLSQFSVLFCHLKRYEYMFSHKTLPINNIINCMPPVIPSPVFEYDKSIFDEYHIPSVVAKHQPFALFISNSRLTSLPKIEINHEIVVVGAGATAIAFLESLIFTRNFKAQIVFTNVSIVSPHGISFHKQPNRIREMVFVYNGHLDRRHMDSICLKSFVHVVTGVMASINRKQKLVGMVDDTYLSYDYLLLLCGEQFQKPIKRKKEIIKSKRMDFPVNAFIINTEADASNAMTTLKNLLVNKKTVTIVVYGHYLESLCTLAAIIEYGVKESNLVYIDPPPETDNPLRGRHDHLTHFFNDKDVESAVLHEMTKLGITVYQDFNFVDWHQDYHNHITSARFESKYKFIELEVTAVFFYCSKTVSARTYQAIHRSGLIFNGKLVINKQNMTNDSFIYAAGPLTMYSAKYQSEHLMHKYFNGAEIGYNLGQQLRQKLVPAEYQENTKKKTVRLQPLVQYCRFPGSLHYLKVYKPGKPTPLDIAMNQRTYGKVLTTGDCRNLNLQGYFRLHLNQYQTVETITCLSKKELNIHNLITLYGKHESLLNNLITRFEMKVIPDLYQFFKEPWACAIYHPKFTNLVGHFNDILSSVLTSSNIKLIDEIRGKFEENKWNKLTKMQADEIEELCRDTAFFELIKTELVDFLYVNHMYLPMYAFKMLITWIFHEIQCSPLFVRTTVSSFSDMTGNKRKKHQIPL